LTSVELAYICNCLSLGEKVDYADGKSQDILSGIVDPQINGGFKTIRELEQFIKGWIQNSNCRVYVGRRKFNNVYKNVLIDDAITWVGIQVTQLRTQPYKTKIRVCPMKY